MFLDSEVRDGKVKWFSFKNTKRAYFLIESRVWLQLVSQRIHLFGYVIVMVFHQAMMVVCALAGVDMNVGGQIWMSGNTFMPERGHCQIFSSLY